MSAWRKESIKREKAKYFMLSFSVAFLMFSLLFFSFMAIAHPDKKKIDENSDRDSISEAYAPEREDALTVLFIGTGGDTEIFLLAKFNPAEGTVPLVVLPPETGILNKGKMEPLGDIYSYGGANYTKEALAIQLGIQIDRYVRMDRNAFIIAADTIGSVEFDLHEDIVLREDGTEQMLRMGRQLLDGRKTALILGSAGKDEEGLERIAQLTAEIINQRMDIALSTVADKVFEKIVNLVDTDISYQDYHDRKQAAGYLAEAGGEPALILSPAGQWNESRSLFTLSDTFLARTAREMG